MALWLRLRCLGGVVAVFLLVSGAEIGAVVPEWIPLFKGIDHAQLTGVNVISQVHVLRIDMHDPDIEFFATPGDDGVSLPNELLSQTTGGFLVEHGVQVAVNANFMVSATSEPSPIDVSGLLISDGQVVSPSAYTGTSAEIFEEIHISSNNFAAIRHGDTFLSSTDYGNVRTAVAGELIMNAGYPYGSTWTTRHPRTAIGYSQDRRYLFLLTADGRQWYGGTYYEGARIYEVANWLKDCGAYYAVNLDGGGSTTMVKDNGAGGAELLNVPIHGGVPGAQRHVAANLGVYALPYVAPPAPMVTNNLVVRDWNWDALGLGSDNWEHVANLNPAQTAWGSPSTSWVGNEADYYPNDAYSGNQWVALDGGTIHQGLTNTFAEGRLYIISVMAMASAYDNITLDFTGDSPENGYRGNSDEYLVESALVSIVPTVSATWEEFTFFHIATAADDGKAIGINISGGASTYVDDVTVREYYSVSDSRIISFAPFSGDVFEMVFTCTTPATSHPLVRTNLADGAWGRVGHSIDGSAPFHETNLTYSAPVSGATNKIYLQVVEGAAFFGIGE